MPNYRGIYSQILQAIEKHPNVELTIHELADITGFSTTQVSNGLSRITLNNLLPELKRTDRGVYVYATDIECDAWQPVSLKARKLIQDSPTKSMTLKQLAKELDCHENYVHVAIELANKAVTGSKIRREVRYVIN